MALPSAESRARCFHLSMSSPHVATSLISLPLFHPLSPLSLRATTLAHPRRASSPPALVHIVLRTRYRAPCLCLPPRAHCLGRFLAPYRRAQHHHHHRGRPSPPDVAHPLFKPSPTRVAWRIILWRGGTNSQHASCLHRAAAWRSSHIAVWDP